jgi:hypothetical protein
MPTERIPLTFPIGSRTASTAKDSRLVNVLKEDGRIVKRPGLAALNITPAIPAGQGQGVFSWNNYLIAAVANTVYLVTGETSSSVLGTITGSQLPLSFATVANDTKLAFHNGANLYTVNAGTPPTFVGGVGLSGVVSSVSITNAGGFYGYSVACTVTVGATTTINASGHGLVVGQGVTFTGTLPTGMVVGTTYQVASTTTNTFTINTATDAGGAGSAVSTSGTSSGVNFLASPTVTFTASPGVTAVGVATLFNHQVSGVILTTHGSGYTSNPTATFSAPPAGAAAGTVTGNLTNISSSQAYISSISGIPTGLGFLTPPTVTFPTGNVTATGYATLNTNGVISIVITNGGNYFPGSYIPVTLTPSTPNTSTATGTVVMSSAGITGPFVPGLAYLDGLCYVMDLNGKVYNSASNDPSTWTGAYLQASSDPDGGTGLIRHLNYLMAFGEWSTEFFYDAGNPIGSPLAVNQSAKLEIGCANGYSIAQAEQTIIWVGQTLTEGRSVYLMDGLSPIKISNRYIEKYLNSASMGNMILLGQTVSSVASYCMKISGHSLYVLTLSDLNITFVYDLDEKEWYQWTSQSGDTGTPNSGTEGYFSPTFFNGNIEYQAAIILQDDDTGLFYKMDPSFTNDNGNLIYMRAVSTNTDSGTTKRKFYKRSELVGDKVSGTAWIRHSGDDYNTWSTYRSMDLSASRSILWQNGTDRRRAHEVFVSDSIPVRLEALEIDFDIGESGQE